MGDTDEYDRAKATAITFVRGGRDLQTALLKDFALDLVLVITGHDARDAQLRLDTIAAVKRLAGVRDHPEQPPGGGAEEGEPLMAADIAAGVAGNRGRAAAAAGSGSKTVRDQSLLGAALEADCAFIRSQFLYRPTTRTAMMLPARPTMHALRLRHTMASLMSMRLK